MMMTLRKHIFGAVAVAALLTGALTASRPAFAEEPAVEPGVFKLAIQPWLGYGMWYIAKEKGFFKANGLEDVELVNFVEDKDMGAAIASGRLSASVDRKRFSSSPISWTRGVSASSLRIVNGSSGLPGVNASSGAWIGDSRTSSQKRHVVRPSSVEATIASGAKPGATSGICTGTISPMSARTWFRALAGTTSAS